MEGQFGPCHAGLLIQPRILLSIWHNATSSCCSPPRPAIAHIVAGLDIHGLLVMRDKRHRHNCSEAPPPPFRRISVQVMFDEDNLYAGGWHERARVWKILWLQRFDGLWDSNEEFSTVRVTEAALLRGIPLGTAD